MPAPARRPRRPAKQIEERPVEALEGETLVWTDGACSGNPGPGGWAAIIVAPDAAEPIECSGGDPDTTNNRMELTAALEGLRALPADSLASIVTDSQLVVNSLTTWLPGWRKKGWKTAAGKPVKNRDLIEALDTEIGRHATVRWQWVRGHETGAAHAHKALNDRADQLAVAAAQAARG